MTGEAFGNQGGHAEPGPSPPEVSPEVSPEVPPEVKHQVRLGGWGVVALMLMMSVMSATASGAQQGDGTAKSYAPYPQPDHGYVTDLAKVLGAQREEAIEQKLGVVEKATGVEIVVVTIGSMSDYPGVPQDIETLSRGLFDVYGVGNLPANNGVLLVVAVKDRAARIELGAGYVHARDGDTNRIMQGRIIPRFRQNDYAGGIEAGVDAIVETFAKKKGEAGKVSGAASGNGVVERPGESQGIETVPPEVVRRGHAEDWSPVVWGVLGIAGVVLVVVSLLRHGKRGWGWVVAGLAIVVVLAVVTMIYQLMKNSGNRGGSYWGSSGFGNSFGGRSSGGFSGGGSGGLGGGGGGSSFGGGFSGGGGATGRW